MVQLSKSFHNVVILCVSGSWNWRYGLEQTVIPHIYRVPKFWPIFINLMMHSHTLLVVTSVFEVFLRNKNTL